MLDMSGSDVQAVLPSNATVHQLAVLEGFTPQSGKPLSRALGTTI